MSIYTTGELAGRCGVSVRTVQFYDKKNLLRPVGRSEGGRRLYDDASEERLKTILLLKALGLSLEVIGEILTSGHPAETLELLLDARTQALAREIEEKQRQKKIAAALKNAIRDSGELPVKSIQDMEEMMKGRNQMKKTYATMLGAGILMDAAEISTLVHWIRTGDWKPFAVTIPGVAAAAAALVRMYYRDTVYTCPQCHEKFKPEMKEFFFARHTARTRRLTCPHCGYQGFCVETYSDGAQKMKEAVTEPPLS